MKSFQSRSVIVILAIFFAACNNAGTDKEATTNTDTTAGTASTTVSEAEANQQKLEANKKTVTDFIQSLYGDKDSAAIDKYLADNIIQHNPNVPDGKESLKKALQPFLSNANVEKSKIDIKQTAAEGDKVWVFIKDVAPNGKIFARVEIFRLENGKIAENWLINEPERKSTANKNTQF